MTTSTSIPNTNPPIQLPPVNDDLIVKAAATSKQILSTAQSALKTLKDTGSDWFDYVQHKVIVTEIPQLIASTNKACSDVERGFNIAGCIPGFGILSGAVRTLIAKAQVIIGIEIKALSELGKFFAKQTSEEGDLNNKWDTLSRFGLEHILHGCLNIMIGTGEVLAGSYTLGLGNVVFLAPNLINNRNFMPYFAYGRLTT
jgi:hypothetical protein